MNEFYPKPTHGTAFKAVIQEKQLLNQFLTMFQKKLELDEQHLAGLIELQKSWAPEWSNANIGALVSPFLKYIEAEIAHRKAAQEDQLQRFQKVTQLGSTNIIEGAGFDPLELPECLEVAYAACQAHEVGKTSREIMPLQNWYANHGSDYYLLSSKRPVPLPPGDLAYRKAVAKQHQLVDRVYDWYANGLPAILEEHQQRAEDIKAFIRSTLGSLSMLASENSASCSVAMRDTSAFQSTRFIAARHDELEGESVHQLIHKFEYRNYYRDIREVVTPIFGLGTEETVDLINKILDSPRVDWSRLLPRRRSASATLRAFELEKAIVNNPDLLSVLATEHPDDGHHALLLLKFAFWSEAPLLPISPEHLKLYRSNIPRRKMKALFEALDPPIRPKVMALIFRLLTGLISQVEVFWACEYSATLLCHTPEAGLILHDIWCQWDFTDDGPLPDGVERVWNAEAKKGEVVWQRTGEPYSPLSAPPPTASGIRRTLTQLRVGRSPRQATTFTV